MRRVALFALSAFTLAACEPSPAELAYKGFVEKFGFENYLDAKTLATGSALGLISHLEKQKQGAGAFAAMVAADQSTVGKVEVVEMKTVKKDDTSADIEATLKICRDANGCAGAGCTKCVQKPHKAKVCENGGKWLVCDTVAIPK